MTLYISTLNSPLSKHERVQTLAGIYLRSSNHCKIPCYTLARKLNKPAPERGIFIERRSSSTNPGRQQGCVRRASHSSLMSSATLNRFPCGASELARARSVLSALSIASGTIELQPAKTNSRCILRACTRDSRSRARVDRYPDTSIRRESFNGAKLAEALCI